MVYPARVPKRPATGRDPAGATVPTDKGAETMKNTMTPQQQIERIIHWLNTMAFLPPESEAGRLRDEIWMRRLEDELATLEVESMQQQTNCLIHLAGAHNHLRKITP